MRVYIAGPYSLGDKEANVKAALDAYDTVRNMGFWPFCPHLWHFAHDRNPRQERDWLAQGLNWLAVCDAVLRIPGDSRGADAEVREAESRSIPVFYTIQTLQVAMEGK